MPKSKEVRLDKIRIDGGTQARAALNMATVNEYSEAMEDGKTFPPLIVYFDGKDYWLGDGFHRFHGYRKAGFGEAECDVRSGTQEDALLFALGANDSHGLPRTNADKRAAVKICLQHPEWAKRADKWIADTCRVSHPFVGKMRGEESQCVTVTHCDGDVRVRRDGKAYSVPEKRSPVNREPGDETEESGEEPLPFEPRTSAVSDYFDKKTKSKAAHKTHFDDSEFYRQYGSLVRLVQSRADVLKCINSPEHKRACAALDELLAAYEGWQKARAA